MMDLSKIEIEVEDLAVTTAEIDAEIDRIADAFRPYTAKQGRCRRGDRLVMDYQAIGFPDFAAAGIQFVDGSNTMWPGMDEQLEGIQAGETRRVRIMFQPDFAIAEMAGREIELDVTVRSVEAPARIKVRDGDKWSNELARHFGWKNAREFRARSRERIVDRYRPFLRERAKRRLLEALGGETELDRVCDAEKIEATPADCDAEMERAFADQNPQERLLTMEEVKKDAETMERLRTHVRREKTVDRLLSKRVRCRKRRITCTQIEEEMAVQEDYEG